MLRTLLVCCALALAAGAQTPLPQIQPPARPPEHNDRTLRPLTPEEIPPNLNFYALDPLYTPGAPLGWATTRIDEKLDRGIVAMTAEGGRVYIGWRLLKGDPQSVTFNVYRVTAGETPIRLNQRPVRTTTDFVDASAPVDRENAWFVRTIVDGREQEESPRATVAAHTPPRGYRASSCATTCAASIVWRSQI